MTEYSLLKDRAIVEISGKDSVSFLQALTTNDISLLESQKSIYNLFLNAQGRFLFDAFIIKDENRIFLDISKNHADQFINRMNLYKLHADVNFLVTQDLVLFYSSTPMNGCISFKDIRCDSMGYRNIMNEAAEIPAKLNPDLYFYDRYKNAIPEGFIDFIPDKTLPPLFSAEKLGAISYTKGCYTGQEVISRTKYQGEVRKQLYKIEFTENINLNLSGKELYQNSELVGYITSNWKGFAIALLKKELVRLEENIDLDGISGKLFIPSWIKK